MADKQDAAWARLKEVLQAALEEPPDSRMQFLDRVCAGEDALRREVESLLAAHEDAAGFLSRPAAETGVPMAEGRRIGAYRVLNEIGRGGMAVVHRAVRDDDLFRKTVALKLLSTGTGSEMLLRRFSQERQILGRLQHPNIAAVFDGGATEEGQPYLVMELVEGRPITEYCEVSGLSTRRRLEMFRAVCEAVQYAHQNLVIHRDLKPGNILVDANGTPKLLDFGIAKLLSEGDGDEAPPTQTLAPMMTPEYASPEQVRGEAVTTASDVYSLGVLLYELLTGTRPYAVRTESLEEIVRAVCTVEPPPPSVSTSARGAELRGDLDTIILKALRKEPLRRYVSAHELSEDVRRYLEGLPVLARNDTVRYRLGKFVGRHRIGVGAAALVVASLVGGMVMTVRQARIAEANRIRAERRFNEVRGLANFVLFEMHDAIAPLPGSTPARKQLAAKGLEYLDGLASEAGSDPVLVAEIARGYTRLAMVQGFGAAANLGEGASALESIRKAIRLREPLLEAATYDPVRTAELATSYGVLVQILEQQGQVAEARGAVEKMESLLESIPSRFADETYVLRAWEQFHACVADQQFAASDLQALRETRRRQVEIAEKLQAREPLSLDRQRSLALAYKTHGAALHLLKEWTAAGERYARALELDRKNVAAEPGNPHFKLDLSFSHASIGSLRRDQGDLDGALDAYAESMKLRQEVYAADPDNLFALNSLVRAHNSLATVYARKADLERAIAQERVGLDLRRAWEKKHPSKYGDASWQALFHAAVGKAVETAASLPGLADARRREHWLMARAEYARARAIWETLANGRPIEGEHAAEPKRLQEAIARCDDALAKLGEATLGRPR
jgi:non-specific serine/threonine protein kinase/serine/threonine-protein kinase